nr:unnamed protein product [Callosobruchus analis]
MYKTIATLAIVAFIQISDAAVPGAVDLRSMLSLGDPSFEIRSGNCRNATMATLVYQDHVHKSRLPFSTREAKVEWFGDETIYCVMALSEKEPSKGSTVEITEGGVGHNYVKLQMKSAKNHGLEYNVQVFGIRKR